MSSNATETPGGNIAGPKPKKNKKRNKKGKTEKALSNGDSKAPNGTMFEHEAEEEGEGGDGNSRTPTEPPTPTTTHQIDKEPEEVMTNGINEGSHGPEEEPHDAAEQAIHENPRPQPRAQGPQSMQFPSDQAALDPAVNGHGDRLEALTREREALREEVSQLRKSLEEFQRKHAYDQRRHEAETSSLQDELARTQSERDDKGSQYQSLLGKVNTIKTQLGDRLKADAEDLKEARSKIEELEEQNTSLREQNKAREAELASLADQGDQQSKELSGLRNRTLLSQQNFSKEREDLLQREAFAKEEFEAAKQAMQEWEILAMEERSIRESIQEKFADLEEQVATHREAHEQAASERDSQSVTVEGLQRALQELQDARRRELREIVENSHSQIESLQKQLAEKETIASETASKVQSLQQDLERALPFEKEVKEKNLLIGKLRHEAVILTDHLTKTLRYVKKGKPEDTIDKQIITNHIMRFLELDRADPKKFQVLQIIAGMLAWTDEQREQAGLTRPGASNPNLRVPISPWHRTPSTPTLNTDIAFDNHNRRESLAELWSEFLEQEVGEAGVRSPKSLVSSAAVSSVASPKPP